MNGVTKFFVSLFVTVFLKLALSYVFLLPLPKWAYGFFCIALFIYLWRKKDGIL